MPRLTQAERNRAIDMVDMGASQRQIARNINCSQAAMSNLLSRYQQTGQIQLRPRSGRSESQRQLKTATSGQSTCGTDSDGDVNGGLSTGTPHQQTNSLTTTPQGWYQSFPRLSWNGLDPSTPTTQITMGTNCTSVAAA